MATKSTIASWALNFQLLSTLRWVSDYCGIEDNDIGVELARQSSALFSQYAQIFVEFLNAELSRHCQKSSKKS